MDSQSLHLVAFGFGIGNFITTWKRSAQNEFLIPSIGQGFLEKLLSPSGVFELAAVVQHRRILKRIEQGEFAYTESLTLEIITAIILLLISLFGFIAVLF